MGLKFLEKSLISQKCFEFFLSLSVIHIRGMEPNEHIKIDRYRGGLWAAYY